MEALRARGACTDLTGVCEDVTCSLGNDGDVAETGQEMGSHQKLLGKRLT